MIVENTEFDPFAPPPAGALPAAPPAPPAPTEIGHSKEERGEAVRRSGAEPVLRGPVPDLGAGAERARRAWSKAEVGE